jgi:hypothetical protein
MSQPRRKSLDPGGAYLRHEERSRSEAAASTAPIEAVTPNRILNVSYAFWRTKALLSAVELNLFTVLAEGPLDLPGLIARLGLHGRGARDFFDALVTLGFLRRDTAGNYSNAPDAALFLDCRKSTYIGGLLEHLNARHYQNWAFLTQALLSGLPQSGALATGSYQGLYADAESLTVFLNGMTAGSLNAAKAIAAKFPWHLYKTVVDIGTAQGCVPVEIASAHQHLTGGGFDLPQVEPLFKTYVQKHGLTERMKFFGGDFLANPLPEADVLVMGRILHNWDLPTRELLLRKAYQALTWGGALIVYDPLIDVSRSEDPHGLLSSLNMLIETSAGSEYTGAECSDWMQRAGFSEIRIESLDDLHSAVMGTKGRAT